MSRGQALREACRDPAARPGCSPAAATTADSARGSALVEVRGLRVEFPSPRGTVVAVKEIDFELPRGRITALIGESGSGKSATCLALLGLLDRARIGGRIRFDELSIAPENAGDQLLPLRGRRIGMIFQDPVASLNPVRTVGSQLRETIRTLTALRRGREVEARAVELLRSARLPDPEALCRCYPHQLSGGMSQRVMIALALAGDPDLLIADEPTTALDVTTQRGILDLLRRLRDESGLTILLVTHDIDIAREHADQLLVMREGALVERGVASVVLASPRHPYTRELLSHALSLQMPRAAAPIPERSHA